jgi:hypothetical protein
MPVMKNKILLHACLAAVLLSLFVAGVHGQESSPSPTQTISREKQALIQELLELTSPKKTVDAMLQAQADQMEKQLPNIVWQAVSGMKELQNLTPKQREEIRLQVVSTSLRSGRRMYELLLQKIDFNKLIGDISLPLYDKYFTEAELRDLVTFQKSATGKKVVEVMPNLMVESMTRTTEIIMPKISEALSQIQAEETQLVTKEIQASVKAREKSAKPAARTPAKRRRH